MSTGPSPFGEVAPVLKSLAEAGDLLNVTDLEARRDGDARVVAARPEPDLDCVVLDDVLSAEECAYLVSQTEKMKYSFWDAREERKTEFRNADTIETHQPEIAALLWNRIKDKLPDPVEITDDDESPRWQRDLEGTWDPYGTNEHLLFARYRQGGHFAPHTDGYNIVSCDERSMYSIVLFLNDCQEGGGTRFYADEQRDQLVKDEAGRYTGRPDLVRFTAAPKAGRMVIFFHNIMHEGVPVGEEAEKYIIRSDVMYRRRDPICKTPRDNEAFRLYQEAQEVSVAGDCDAAMTLFRRAFKMSPTLADIYG
ncbi:Hypothetical Protein FCC1311_085412 [Hondaea fermentalgiana]|uniref:Fe2OG dioxygenase domain-containing protein n=1 Tax=Hondaea fermentalgiana TaxID=2315210 RepID=A0A2R5GN47_9STRA|nr:Hypothetical Protein FCC1311_085412 [Hondaea fermentalgiana]|eukprot:GBG32316.1 Hypothetical Protein FCC1311_085412 [Hondaea fermentalgiana]